MPSPPVQRPAAAAVHPRAPFPRPDPARGWLAGWLPTAARWRRSVRTCGSAQQRPCATRVCASTPATSSCVLLVPPALARSLPHTPASHWRVGHRRVAATMGLIRDRLQASGGRGRTERLQWQPAAARPGLSQDAWRSPGWTGADAGVCLGAPGARVRPCARGSPAGRGLAVVPCVARGPPAPSWNVHNAGRTQAGAAQCGVRAGGACCRLAARARDCCCLVAMMAGASLPT